MQKNMIYLKQDYTDLLLLIKEGIKESRKETDQNMSGLYYNMSYNAFSGLIRSGVLHEKRNGIDGLAEFSINVVGKEYSCKDFVLKEILGEEYEFLIHPYQDTSYLYTDVVSKKTFHKNEYDLLANKDTGEIEQQEAVKFGEKVQGVTDKIKNINLPSFSKEKEVKEDPIFEYDPDYDHFYDSELPRLIEKTDSVTEEIGTKSLGIIVMGFISVLCLIFLL